MDDLVPMSTVPQQAARARRATRTGPAPGVALEGAVERAAVLTMAELRRLPRCTAEAVYRCGRRGDQVHAYAGPRLLEVLMAAGPRFDPVIGKDRVRFLVAVTGRDGHVAVLSWAEIDPRYRDGGVLLATDVDGRGLDAEGPQLVVPGDVAGGRYVSGIVSIWTGPAAGA